MNQDQTPVRAATPENDKAKPIHGAPGADQAPPKAEPVKEAAPATPPKA